MTGRVQELVGEEYCYALLLRMVMEHCATMGDGELSSYHIGANGDAMLALAEAGFIRITEQADDRILATLLPAAHALNARFAAEKGAGKI